MIGVGSRVGTIDGPPGTVRFRGRNYEGNEVVDVELDGHAYGPGKPFHRYPIGMVWAVETPAPEPAPTPDSEPSAPFWYPTSTADDDAEPHRHGDEWWADYSDPGRASRPTDAVIRARKVRRARHADQD